MTTTTESTLQRLRSRVLGPQPAAPRFDRMTEAELSRLDALMSRDDCSCGPSGFTPAENVELHHLGCLFSHDINDAEAERMRELYAEYALLAAKADPFLKD